MIAFYPPAKKGGNDLFLSAGVGYMAEIRADFHCNGKERALQRIRGLPSWQRLEPYDAPWVATNSIGNDLPGAMPWIAGDVWGVCNATHFFFVATIVDLTQAII
jgi:hypothetical protein